MDGEMEKGEIISIGWPAFGLQTSHLSLWDYNPTKRQTENEEKMYVLCNAHLLCMLLHSEANKQKNRNAHKFWFKSGTV